MKVVSNCPKEWSRSRVGLESEVLARARTCRFAAFLEEDVSGGPSFIRFSLLSCVCDKESLTHSQSSPGIYFWRHHMFWTTSFPKERSCSVGFFTSSRDTQRVLCLESPSSRSDESACVRPLMPRVSTLRAGLYVCIA